MEMGCDTAVFKLQMSALRRIISHLWPWWKVKLALKEVKTAQKQEGSQ